MPAAPRAASICLADVVPEPGHLALTVERPEMEFLISVSRSSRGRRIDEHLGDHLLPASHERQDLKRVNLEASSKLEEIACTDLAMAPQQPRHPGPLGAVVGPLFPFHVIR